MYELNIPIVTARWYERNQLVSAMGMHGSGMVRVACCPAQRAIVSEEHENHSVQAYEVLLDELLPIPASTCEWNERSKE
jgi:hypothetical protein